MSRRDDTDAHASSCLQLRPTSLRERRGKNILLVWKEIPHWLVVDADLDELLGMFGDGATLNEVLQQRPEWAAQRGKISALLKHLSEKRVLAVKGQPNATPTAFDAGAPMPIENLALNLTRRCNLRCQFCYNLSHLNHGGNELAADEILGFLKADGFEMAEIASNETLRKSL